MIPKPPGNDEQLLELPPGEWRTKFPSTHTDAMAAIEAQQQRFREGWRWHFAGQQLAAATANASIDDVSIKQAVTDADALIKELEGGK